MSATSLTLPCLFEQILQIVLGGLKGEITYI